MPFLTYWLIMDFLGNLGPKDTRRLDFFYGFLSPEMMVHWNRFLAKETWFSWEQLKKGGVLKVFVNVFVEWTRLDSQRAVKTSFDVIVLLLFGFFLTFWLVPIFLALVVMYFVWREIGEIFNDGSQE